MKDEDISGLFVFMCCISIVQLIFIFIMKKDIINITDDNREMRQNLNICMIEKRNQEINNEQ